MARKRLEEAILAGQSIGSFDQTSSGFSSVTRDSTSSIASQNSSHNYNQKLMPQKVSIVKHVSNVNLNVTNVPLFCDKYGIFSINYNPDGTDLGVGFGNGGVCVVHENKTATELIHGHRNGLAVMALKFHQNKKLLFSASTTGDVKVWDVQNMSKIEPLTTIQEGNNEISALDLCADGMLFATAGKDRHIRLYDAKTLTLYHTITAPDVVAMDDVSVCCGHTKRVFALRFHPEENHIFITAGWDDCMKIWDKRMARTARRSLPGPHVCGSGLDVIGNTILTASWTAKNALQLWDLRGGEVIKNISFPHDAKSGGEFLYCARYINPDVVVAGGSGTNTACIIDIAKDEVLDKIESDKPIITADVCNEGKIVAAAGIGGNLQVLSRA